MTRRMSSREARANFSDLIASVHYGQDPVIVERKGKPFAVVISPKDFEQYQKAQRERLFELIDEVQGRNEDRDPVEIEADIDRAIEEVRQKLGATENVANSH